MAFIDQSYFNNDISIPGTSGAGQSSLVSSIERYEEESLIKVLGYELYKLVVADSPAQIYTNIIKGKEFTFEFCGKNVTRKWIGLQNDSKKSMLAYYVFFMYWKDRILHNSNAGFGTPKLENADQDNPRRTLVTAYNQFVKLAGDIDKVTKCTQNNRHYRRPRVTINTFDKFDLSTYEFMNDEPSLYNFLLANVSDYPEWEFEPQKNVNLFDL